MEHFVSIVDTQHIKMKAIFESDLLISRSTSDFKVYQEIFPEFVSSLKEEASIVTPSGPINLYPDIPAVIYIWPEIKCIICNINQFMKHF